MSTVDKYTTRSGEQFISPEIESFIDRFKRRLQDTYTRVVLTEKIINDQKRNDDYTKFYARRYDGVSLRDILGIIPYGGVVDLKEADILSYGC